MTYLSHEDRRKILHAVLCGRSEAAFTEYQVPVLEQAIFLAESRRLISKAAVRTANIKGFYKVRRQMPLRRGLLLSVVAAAIPFGTACLILCRYDLTNSRNFPLIGAAATLLGVAAAAIGWGVASWTAFRNARAQHTLNFLATRFSNNNFSDQTAIFNRYFTGRRIDKSLINEMASSNDKDATEALQALRHILNWFEFISAGVLIGDLDLEIVTKTVRGNLIFYTDKCMPYISEVQKNSPSTLENLTQLRLHFREP